MDTSGGAAAAPRQELATAGAVPGGPGDDNARDAG